MIEIIWTPSAGNFFRDLTIMHQSDAQIKVVIVNEKILLKPEIEREFKKAKISEAQKGFIVSPMINGSRILTDKNYLNADVKNQIMELISDSRISLELEVEKLGERILSNEPISPIIAKCLEISKKIDVNPDHILWLNRELYGYADYVKNKPDDSEFEEFPNYRKIKGEIRIGFVDEETCRQRLEVVDKPMLLTQPAAELEEFLFRVPASYFQPKNPLQSKIPIVHQTSTLRSCMQELRLRLHKYLNDELIPKLQ